MMSNRIKILIILTITIISSLLLNASVFAAAGINPQFNYQGRLTNSSGANVSDGAYNFVFKLYTASSGGSAIWTETWNTTTRFSSTVTGTPPISGGTSVTYTDDATEAYLAIGDALYNTTANDEVIIEAFNTTTNTITISPTSKAWSASDAITTRIYVRSGLFSSRLGSIASLSSINLNQTPLYLGVAVGADSEMTPRKRIASVLQSFQANKLDGYLTSTSTSAGTEYGSTLTISDTGIVTTGTDTTYGLNISTTRTGATGGEINTYGLYSAVTGDTGGTSTAVGGYFSATGADNNYGLIVENGNVGIGTTSPTAGKLVIAQTDAANLQALTIDTEESTGTQNVFSVISDYGSDENTILNLTAAGDLKIDGGLTTGGASTIYADGSITKSSGSALSVILGGAAGDDFIVDTNTLVVESDNDRVGIGTTAPNTALDLNGSFSVRGMSAPSVSPSGQGRIYYDSTANKMKISENGGAYGDLVGDAGAVTWKKIYENDITLQITSTTISGLDGNTDIEYMIIARIVNGSVGSLNYWLRPNNDSATNYGYQYVQGSDTTVSAARVTSAVGLNFGWSTTTSNITMIKGLLYTKSGYIRTMSAELMNNVSGTTVGTTYKMDSVWNNTADNITSLVIAADQNNGLGVGTHIEVYARRSGGGSVWALNGNSAYYTSGNVGVGLNNPSHKLQITDTDTTASRAGIYVAQSGAISGTGYAGYFTKTGASTTNIAGYFSATGATNNYGLIVENGNVGIGTTSPILGRLQLNQAADNNTSGIAMYNAAVSQTSRLWMNGNTMNFGIDGTTVMSYNDVNVGIGTTTPGYKLDVAGNALLGGTLHVDNSIGQGGIDSNTKLMLSADGSDGSTSFIDSSSGGKTVTANGNVQIDTAQKKFGTASGLFDGTGDYLTSPDSNDWYFTGDFTIDFQVRFNNLLSSGAASYLYAQKEAEDTKIVFGPYNNAGTMKWLLFIRNGVGDGGALTYEVATTFTVNTWYHIALVRSGNNWYIFQDGVQVGSTLVNAKVLNNFDSVLYSGVTNELVGNFDGWLDEYRVSKGVARWTSNFTPPSAPYDSNNIGNVGIGMTSPSHKLQITDTNTTASRAGIYVAQSGAISGTGYAGYFTKTGASTTNIAGYFSATGATNNYGLIVENGNVGIGDASPAALLTVGAGDAFQVNSSGLITTASVGTAALRTATGSATGTVTTDITMNDYAFFPSITAGPVGATPGLFMYSVANPGNTIGRFRVGTEASGWAVNWRYITASDRPIIWLIVNTEGIIQAVWESEDPVNQREWPENPNPFGGTELQENQYFLSPEPLTVNQLKALYGKFSPEIQDEALSEFFDYIVSRGWLNSISGLDDISLITERYQPAAREWALRFLAKANEIDAATAIRVFLRANNNLIVTDNPQQNLIDYKNQIEQARTAFESLNPQIKQSDIAEFYSTNNEEIVSGELVVMDSEMGFLRKTNSSYEKNLLGVVSTSPSNVLGNKVNKNDIQLALVGRVPVKVSLENGQISAGDKITSSSLAGVGMKATEEGPTVGIALEPLTSESQYEEGKNYAKILLFINLGWNHLDSSAVAAASANLTDNSQLTTNNQEQAAGGGSSNYWLINSSGRLTSTVDLDLGGKSVYNIGSLFSASGKWKLDESGYLEIEKVVAKEIETEKLKIGALDLPAGITLYDLLTKEPYCLYIESGEIKKQTGECESNPLNNTNIEPIDTNNSQEIASPLNELGARNDGEGSGDDNLLPATDNSQPTTDNSSEETGDQQPSDANLETGFPSEPQP